MIGTPSARCRRFDVLTEAAAWQPRDGARLVQVGDFAFLLGGWNPAIFSNNTPIRVTNQIFRASISDLTTWTMIHAQDDAPPISGPTACWPGRHAMGALVMDSNIIILASDIFSGDGTGTSDVWMASVSSGSLGEWSRLTDDAPWGPLSFIMAGTLGNAIHVVSGQRTADPATVVAGHYVSSDYGASWAALDDVPFSSRALVYDPVEFRGRLWICGGSTYAEEIGDRTFYTDVWSYGVDGWRQEADPPWSARGYHSVFVADGLLWVSNGVDEGDHNIGDLWWTSDGETWNRTYIPAYPYWVGGHADGIAAVDDAILYTSGNALEQTVRRVQFFGGG